MLWTSPAAAEESPPLTGSSAARKIHERSVAQTRTPHGIFRVNVKATGGASHRRSLW